MKTTCILIGLLFMVCAGFSEDQPPPLAEVFRLQRAIEVPHNIDILTTTRGRLYEGRLYENASVIRVEPDGIHVRHAEGIAKLNTSVLKEETREKYHLYSEHAQWSTRRREEAAVTADPQQREPEPQQREPEPQRKVGEWADASGSGGAGKTYVYSWDDNQDRASIPKIREDRDPVAPQEQQDKLVSWANRQRQQRHKAIADTRTPGGGSRYFIGRQEVSEEVWNEYWRLMRLGRSYVRYYY